MRLIEHSLANGRTLIAAASASSSVHFGWGKAVIYKSMAIEFAFPLQGTRKELRGQQHPVQLQQTL